MKNIVIYSNCAGGMIKNMFDKHIIYKYLYNYTKLILYYSNEYISKFFPLTSI